MEFRPTSRAPFTLLLSVWMIAVYLVDPPITEISYIVLAPWMHSGWFHFWNNLVVFVLLGLWTEQRVEGMRFFAFVVLVPYLALYVPVVYEYGGLSRGASGMTMALTGYAVPALLTAVITRLGTEKAESKEVAAIVLQLLALLYLTSDTWTTVERFVGLTPRPAGVAVSAHMTALVLGLLWFGWRSWRYGVSEA